MFTIDDYLYVLYAYAVDNAAKVAGISPESIIDREAIAFCGGEEFINETSKKDGRYSELVETMKDVFRFKYRKGKRISAEYTLTVTALGKVPLPRQGGIVVPGQKEYYELSLRSKK